MKLLMFIAALLCVNIALGQTLQGFVYDEEENKPLEGAFVYVDGTTFSASTNAKGYFKIVTPQQFNAPLVISFIGFETLRIEEPYSYNKPFKAVLRTDAIALKEVVINKGGPFSRRQMLKVFREQFLGTTRAGSSCKIENEDDINLYFDLKTNSLRAQAYKPIRIINKRLEYKINFDLADFEVNYSAKTLDAFNMRRSFFAGTTFFTDISKNHSADKKRKEVYLGSAVHFMKTIAKGDWQEQKYGLYADRWPADPNRYFSVTDSLSFKKVTLIDIPPGAKKIREEIAANSQYSIKVKEKKGGKFSDVKFDVLYDKQLQSGLMFNNGYFYIDANGLFFPLSEITFVGYMGDLKAGDLLPADYVYTP
ncbi:hypothetical protein GR160_12025 [Flavobacterium sp. Sd200]|uniref:carboxypeptidase-like regulatory domain-containing protein n=1 Tax=Flavobacterium sp. Sd200 TaxID=2692211 RepID=UPI0013697E32|nr:carboxypeptidase-like regulatory domain-containing protein [Flavobacterium sp. Sd200]MXN91952.1 hypothetical protein [Flavobacterium sp. Sd200]